MVYTIGGGTVLTPFSSALVLMDDIIFVVVGVALKQDDLGSDVEKADPISKKDAKSKFLRRVTSIG
jgi:hypothetical protein